MSTIRIDLADPTPPYEQIRRAILEQLALGALLPGDRLPTIRALARDLGIAPGTVGRAYKELEEAGVLLTRRGAGTQVAELSREQLAALAPASAAVTFGLPGAANAGAVQVDLSPGPGSDSDLDPGFALDPDLERLAADVVDAARSDGHADPAILEAVRRALAVSAGTGRA